MSVLPQEIQVWYIIPALRRELARVLIEEHGLAQRKVASILDVSEGAVSQYLNSKRGVSLAFDIDVLAEIKLAASRINQDNAVAMAELIRLSEMDSVKMVVCSLHMSQDSSVPKTCGICFK